MRGLAWIAVLTAGCRFDTGLGDDPFDGWPCVAGHERLETGGCQAQPVDVTIDGDASEWTDVTAVATGGTCLAPPCDGLLPDRIEVGVYAVEPGLPDLVLHVELADGAAPRRDDPDVRYRVRFRPTPEYPTGLGDVILSMTETARGWTIGETSVSVGADGTTITTAWTDDGFEYESFVWPPVRGAADVTVWTERRSGAAWTQVATSEEIRVCSIASEGHADPCAEEPP